MPKKKHTADELQAMSLQGSLVRRGLTHLLAVPDHQLAQIIEGTLHVHPRPASPHARAASTMGIDIGGPFDRGRGGPGGWLILDGPELHLARDIVVPDLAGWRRERMPEMPDAPYFTMPPALVHFAHDL